MAQSLTDYVLQTRENIEKYGGDGNIVYKSSASEAMIMCHKLAQNYSNQRKIKNLPLPISITNKSDSESGEAYTQMKFPSDINLETLEKAIDKIDGDSNNIVVSPNDSAINIEFYTQTQRG